ncbi:hypothetical protein [Antrihabitans sp. YC2-6]|uniref:hypothetical protein n=1 Tax=Antrihabitans sp. YC2-6 TaxID=2799498 RepID=UPI0018F6D993|nr:hypothetical protein [Antrihabitans sp. YC2-6]MBJ8347754.1 hypothetical protein [Antrihabitans sp. YC2-6]
MLATGLALIVVFLVVAYLRNVRAAPGVQGLLVAIAGVLTAVLAFQVVMFIFGD